MIRHLRFCSLDDNDEQNNRRVFNFGIMTTIKVTRSGHYTMFFV